MAVKFPETERPYKINGFSGGDDVWDDANAGPILTADFFESAGPSSQTLTPSLFSNGNTFFAPTVTAGAVNLQPALFTNTSQFYPASITTGPVTLFAGLFSNTSTFYAHAVFNPYIFYEEIAVSLVIKQVAVAAIIPIMTVARIDPSVAVSGADQII